MDVVVIKYILMRKQEDRLLSNVEEHVLLKHELIKQLLRGSVEDFYP
jgi:hypothetical protein